ncbi:anthranilate synthase component I family protein [Nocardioides dongxiaopingii]|uniref:anthranilate synthase component I family protein n=1 Tax=Nocardioides dongxiaopingii TaxID=2576036 RepID=UPI0010C76B61|nr:anthranilate synthase component I family protein [Nocardioides dongxiaopingii]
MSAAGSPGDVAADFAAVAASHPRCLWLDGGGAREWSGRRSVLGWLDPGDVSLTYSAARREVTRWAADPDDAAGTLVGTVVGDDVFAVLEAELATGEGQWFGYLGYAARPDLPAAPDPTLPDAVWMRPSHLRRYDHLPGEVGPSRVDDRPASGAGAGPAGDPGAPPASYAGAFGRVQEHLHAGNTYEVNLTHRIERSGPAAPGGPVATYLRLRALNPAPYAGFLQHDVPGARAWLLASSPERYALVSAERVLETKPIKGTTPRGATAAEDAAHRAELATHPRYRAENLMIVDLLRNDLAQVCEVGTVTVPELMAVESYETVHQLVSTVRGRLRDDVSTVAALRALFPAGSMTGAPKLRTMQVIEEVEATPRGPYAGAFGWISADGRADLGVVIRSLVTAGDGRYTLGTGGGVTVLSEPDAEWAEAQLKAERLLRTLDDVSR